eukprot:7053383-Prymnesium_polylepis.1
MPPSHTVTDEERDGILQFVEAAPAAPSPSRSSVSAASTAGERAKRGRGASDRAAAELAGKRGQKRVRLRLAEPEPPAAEAVEDAAADVAEDESSDDEFEAYEAKNNDTPRMIAKVSPRHGLPRRRAGPPA